MTLYLRWSLRALTAFSIFAAPIGAGATEVEAAFARYGAAHPNLAIVVSVSRPGEETETYVAGPVSPGSIEMARSDAPWHMGSATKAFTATLTMQLAEEGKVTLDAPIGQWLDAPDVHPDWKNLTLRMLLSHGSGLPSNPSAIAWLRRHENGVEAALAEELSRLWDEPIDGQQGNYAYSNLGYMLAAHVIANASGTSWRTLVGERIAKPLGLDSLGYGAPRGEGVAWGQLTLPFLTRRMHPEGRFADNPEWMDAAGRIHMTMDDFITWGRAHLDSCAGRSETLLTQEACQEMQRPQTANYGLGWLVGRPGLDDVQIIWHNGSNLRWYAMLMLVPKHDVVIALAQNRFDYEGADALLHEVLLSVLGEG